MSDRTAADLERELAMPAFVRDPLGRRATISVSRPLPLIRFSMSSTVFNDRRGIRADFRPRIPGERLCC